MHEKTAKLARSRMKVSTSSQLHGVLVRVFSTGVLIVGESGIGKSECALELVTKGHRLVADDVVEVSVENEEATGRAPELTRELLEIRGLGIINVRELFGPKAMRAATPIDLCIEFQKNGEIDRIENPIGEYRLGKLSLPKFVIPVRSGRNLSTLVETAVRILRSRGLAAKTRERLIQKQAALLSSAK